MRNLKKSLLEGGLTVDIITKPLGMILSFIYNITNSYGLSIILFTILTKLLLLPLAIKQQKSIIEMQKVQPLLNEIQKKYKNDKEKLNQEMMKIYQEHKVNPAGGCLPLLIQLPIIYALYRVIYQPLKYMLSFSREQIAAVVEALNLEIAENLFAQKEIFIAEQMRIHFDKLNHLEFLKNIKPINFHFLNFINLADAPNMSNINILWIFPILAALTTYLSSKVTSMSTNSQQQGSQPNDQAAQMQKSMLSVFPIMTALITFSLPAGIGLYWIISNIFQIGQQIFLNKYFAPIKKEGMNNQ